jgi:hypothetical protein
MICTPGNLRTGAPAATVLESLMEIAWLARGIWEVGAGRESASETVQGKPSAGKSQGERSVR